MRYLLFCLVLAASLLPLGASASATDFFGPVFPAICHCDSVTGPSGTPVPSAPAFGCVLQTIQNVIKLAISVGIVLATLALIYAGFIWMTSRGKPEQISQGRKLLLNVFIGLAVMLMAWLIVDFVMKTLYSEPTSFGPWNSILAGKGDSAGTCLNPRKPIYVTTGELAIPAGTTPNAGAGGPVSNGTGGTVSNTAGKSGLNTPAATSYARSHAASSSTGQCALYVRQALGNGGGLRAFKGGVGNANQFGGPLQKAGFTQVYSGTYGSNAENLSGVRVGDVVVFQAVPGHPYGHVAIYDGSNWISDYVQRTMSSNPSDYQGGSYAIYRP